MKISHKLAVTFLAIALIPISILGVFAYVNINQTVSDQIDQQINDVLERQRGRLQEQLEQDTIETTLVFGDPTDPNPYYLREYNAKPSPALQQKLIAAVKSVRAAAKDESYRRVHLAALNGSIVASTDARFIGRDYKNEPAFTRGLEGENVSYFFKDIDGALAQYRSNSVELDRQTIGVVIIEAEVTPYFAIVNDYTFLGRTGETFVTGKDDAGQPVYLLPQRFNPDGALAPYTPNTATTIQNYRGKIVQQAIQPLPGFGWTVGVMIDREEAYGPVNTLRNATLLVVGLTATVVLIIGLYLSQRITAPIRSFTEVVKQIKAGDLKRRVQNNSHDEIGLLATVFNEMTNKLQEYSRSLEAKVHARTQELEVAQIKLQQNLKQNEALLTSIGDGVIATDRNGNFTWMNKSAATILQVQPQEMIGQKYDKVWHLETEKGEPIPPEQQPINQALAIGRQVLNSDHYYVRKDAAGNTVVRFAIAVNVAPVILGEALVGTIVVFRDVTHERQVDRMKTEFISLASHQLRTPLSAIKWFIEMLLNGDAGKLQPEQEEFAKNVSESTERMIELVNSLLNISRIESGRIMIDPKPTDLNELVGGIITDLKGKTETKKQTLIVSVHKDLPKINIDPRLIGQVYMNLLTNAIKYTPKGGEISVFVSRKDDMLVSQVTDNGYGIPVPEQGKMFQKFFRATNIAKVETDGTGLGMYLVKSIIESSGGSIWFKSEENKGTTFWFTLPMSGMKAKAGEVTLEG